MKETLFRGIEKAAKTCVVAASKLAAKLAVKTGVVTAAKLQKSHDVVGCVVRRGRSA